MRVEYVGIAIVALFWGAYPLITRSAAGAGHLGTLVLSVSSLIPVIGMLLWQGAPVRPESAALYKMMIAGLMMGVGLVAFIMVSNSRQLEASVSIPIMDTSMLIVTVIGAVVFFSEPLDARKLLGIALLICGILILRPE